MLRRVLLGLLVLSLYGCASNPKFEQSDKLILETWQIINNDFVDGTFNHQDWWQARKQFLAQPHANQGQTYATITAMVTSLGDPYTRFLPPRKFSSLQTEVSGEFSGVGLEIALDPKSRQFTIVAPYEGSPAYKAGLKPNDVIRTINGEAIGDLEPEAVGTKLRGANGTTVELGIQRGAKAFSVQLKRTKIEVNPVRHSLKQLSGIKIGYIRLPSFTSFSPDQVKKAILDLERQGVQGYILDLRLNPGGLFASGVDVARLWLPEGKTIVSTITRRGLRDATRTSKTAPLTNKPLVLLVDGGSASSSEVLSGALQDNGRAKLVGTKTFGKGLIQQIYTLSDGSGLAVSIAKYQTPKGRDIHKIGIQPDLEVQLSQDLTALTVATPKDNQFVAAAQVLAQSVIKNKAA